MKAFDVVELMKEYSAITQSCCMYICLEPFDIDESLKAAPYLDIHNENHSQLIADEQGVLIFDSEEEMEDAFWKTVGDDGPTKLNPYSGPAKVYALTCINGELGNENT